jgi:hypothetical protein
MLLAQVGLNRAPRTIYDNAQNVHTEEVEESLQKGLEFLHSFPIAAKGDTTNMIDFNYVQNEILSLVEAEKKEAERKSNSKLHQERADKINTALTRISVDRALYSKYHSTLSNILLRVWTYISTHVHKDELCKRLLEELVEMAGTCSSGYATRLLNVLSGYGDYNIVLSWRDQITANLAGRLNARIREMDDLMLQEKILLEMTVNSSEYVDRRNFLAFFRKTLPSLRAELYEEFKSHVSDVDFDLYFRAAVTMYENGEMS